MNQSDVSSLQLFPPKNEAEYIEMVERFSGLVDEEMKKVESEQGLDRVHAIALRLPALISLVNAIGYFRGEDGVFLDIPSGRIFSSGTRGSLYKNQDVFEKRLGDLIHEVMASHEADGYIKNLERYYIASRTEKAG